MTAIRYISDTGEIIKASWLTFQHDGVAAFELSERSSLPPALSAKDLPRGRTHEMKVQQINRSDFHPAETDEDSALESISDTEHWLDRNSNLEIPDWSDDDWEADDKSDIVLHNGIEDPDSTEL